MRCIVRVSHWLPTDNDFSEVPVSAELNERLANPDSMVETLLWHNGYVLQVEDDSVSGDSRTLTCQVVDVDGPTLRGWILNSERTSTLRRKSARGLNG